MNIEPEKAYLITGDGDVREIMPKSDAKFTLEEMQMYVDGYIEVVRLNESQIMVVNEEGKYGKPYNMMATAIAELERAIRKDDYIAGDAVICPGTMLD